MGTIYNLAYEHVHQNGQSIVFKELDGQTLSSQHLHTVQLKMIQSNRIPHLLSLSVENIDLATKLHFNINSKHRVSSYFRNNSSTMSDYYQLFLSIIKALEDSSSYMLNQENFILRTDFIFIGENASDIYLVYLPVKGIKKDSTVVEDMKQLLTDIAGEVEGLQGNEFKSILSYIKNASFSLNGLKKLLLELISLRSNVNPFQPYGQYQNSNTTGYPSSSSGDVKYSGNQEQNSQAKLADNQFDDVVPNGQKGKKKAKKRLPALTSREKVYMFAGAVVALGLIWKLYDLYTNSMFLAICSSLSVIILVGLFIYAKVWRPGTTKVDVSSEEESNDEQQQPAENRSVPQNQASFQRNMVGTPNVYNQAPQPEKQVIFPNAQEFTTHQNVAAATSLDTTLLSPQSEDTVLLEDEGNMEVQQSESNVYPLLQRSSEDGRVDSILVNSNNFLIGRNSDSVHLTEEATGVSRIHAEIVKIDPTSYGLKDLGSKNGTKLNGNKLVPYKVYALNENDEFILGKAIYMFKWSTTE